jgi:hypothetical protein
MTRSLGKRSHLGRVLLGSLVVWGSIGCSVFFPLSDIGTEPIDLDTGTTTSDALDASDSPDTVVAPDTFDSTPPPPPPCDDKEKPLDTGIFVSMAGGNDLASGKSASPLKTLAAAMVLAATGKVADVYVDEGTYSEVVAIKSATVLHGGWKRAGAGWTRDCGSDAALKTLVNPSAASAIVVSGFTGKAGLENVAVVTDKAKGAASESMIVIAITGDGILFHALGVDVTSSAGGDGAAPAAPPDPGNLSCNGVSDFSTGAPGTVGPDGPPAKAGTFGAIGYTPGDGTAGTGGTPGANGTAGGPGETRSPCDTSCGSGCVTSSTGTLSGNPGKAGCGGKGGSGGPPGKGGGASVGVFIAGKGSTLSIDHATVRAADGGLGSSGIASIGGGGTSGAGGKSGSFGDPFCGTCLAGSSPCGLSGSYIGGGSAGGPGGKGGAGGRGGGGAGGPSYSIVAAGGAKADIDSPSTSLMAGKGGVGGNGAPAGTEGATLTVP